MLVYWNLSDFQHVRHIRITFKSDQWERTMFMTVERKIKAKTGRRQRPSVRLTLLRYGRREVSERSVDTELNAVTNNPTVMPLHLLSETADSTKQLVIQKFNATTLHLSMDSTRSNGHPLSYANFTPIYQAIHKQCWSILYAPHCSPCYLEKWNQFKCWLVTCCRSVSTPISPSRRHVPWLHHTNYQHPQHTPLATEMGELLLHRIGRHKEHDVTYCYSTWPHGGVHGWITRPGLWVSHGCWNWDLQVLA